MKSFLSLERSATFTCRKGGVERKYLVYEGDEFVNFDLIHQKPTKEENGVIAELCIKDWSEKLLFMDKAKAKLAYYDTVVLIIDGLIVKNDIHRNEVFQYSSLNRNSHIHIALKDVYYTIDYEALGIAPVQLPVAIRLGLGDGLTPTPSRESYITNDKVRKLLLDKITDIADWFVKRYNKTVTEFSTLVEAFSHLGNTNYEVSLEGKSFYINPIIGLSKSKILEPTVKGLVMKDGLWYKTRHRHLLQSYSACGYTYSNGTSTSKEAKILKDNNIFGLKKKAILVGSNYVGNIKTYLHKKHGNDQIFLRYNNFVRGLGGIKENQRLQGISAFPDSYYNILNLRTENKKKWRKLIEEWLFVLSTITSTFIDETDVANTKEYQDWLEKKKANQKAMKAAGYIGGTYSGLNKQKGDVTLAFSYERYDKVHFKKEVFPIDDMEKNKFLTVIIDPDDAEKAKPMAMANACGHVKFAVVGKLERKKLPNTYQFITFKDYISMTSKPFTRLASAILFKRIVEEFDALVKHKNGVFRMVTKGLIKDIDILDSYQKKYVVSHTKKEVESAILQAAEENKLFDMQYWDVYQRVRAGLKKYDFVFLFQEPSYYDTELRKRYETIVNQVLLFRKKNYDDLEGAQIIFKKD